MTDPAPGPRASPEYLHEIVAPSSDVDDLGHVSNVAIVRWVQEAALAHSAAVGWDFEAYLELGAVFVIRRIEIDYLRPAFAGDRIHLTTWVEGWKGASSVRRTRIVRGSDGLELARAKVQWAMVDLATGRPRRIPPEMGVAFAVDPYSVAGPRRAP
ncbi:MAG: acyl-CoA thioesterase [Deltaproteobacteria bacterium]|nr:acyl-CoA thioesterase [Deltaproteobacteria bacterium]